MFSSLKQHLVRWRANPRRFELGYVASRTIGVTQAHLARKKDVRRDYKLEPPIENEYISMLSDPDFKRSVAEVRDYTCLDLVRLANLWMLAKMAGTGTFLEVGSFRGGTALHICNAMEGRDTPFFSIDPFETGGFENLIDCDRAWKSSDFTNTHYDSVCALLANKSFAKVIRGFFPAAAKQLDLDNIAFCHLDVDIYNATLESLEYLAPRLAPKGVIVVDDTGHNETPGVDLAVRDFVAANPAFLVVPMFPCQSVLMPKHLW
jgi:O-methyltransferase